MRIIKNVYSIFKKVKKNKFKKEPELQDYSKEVIELNMMIQNGLIM